MKDSHTKETNNQGSCADSVLCKIQDEKLSPRGRWYFVLKNELFWGVGILSVAIGSCSVAAALYALRSSDFGMYQVTHDSFLEYSYDALPFIWLLSLALFIFVGYMQVKHTSRGYRYPIYLIIGGSLVLSVAGGVVLHSQGFGERLENKVGRYIPFHRMPGDQRKQLWLNSSRGMVAGQVVAIENGTTSFTVKDFQGKPWIIAASELTDYDIALITLNDNIRVIGLPATTSTSTLPEELLATSTLHACILLPWSENIVFGVSRPENGDMNRAPIQKMQVVSVSSSGEWPREDSFIPVSKRMGPATTTIAGLRQKANEKENESERKVSVARITECKDVRPYQLISKMRAEAQY